MKVLITGHLGSFIGAVMATLVQKAGHEVTGLELGSTIGCDFGSPAAPISVRSGPICATWIASPVKGFDAVIHLAALSNDPLGDFDAQLTYDINHLATVTWPNLAREAGVGRFVFSSSCSNYGAAGDTFSTKLGRSIRVTPYGVSKVRAEEAIW